MKQKKKSKYAGKKDRRRNSDPFVLNKVYIPFTLQRKLEEIAASKGISIEKLILAAAMNTRDGIASFDIDISIPPGSETTIGLYPEEEKLLLRWIAMTNYGGVGLDMIVACRDDIGIPDRRVLMYAFYSLFKMCQIDAIQVGNEKVPRIRISSIEKVIRRKRFKTFAGENPTELCDTTNVVSEKKTGISSL
jgi:hypothetical protein